MIVKKSMDKELQEECKKLLEKYHKYKTPKLKQKARNTLYCLIQPWLHIWIMSILSGWHKSERRENILSMSWDVYMFCIDRYKQDYGTPIPKYFYQFTRYYLLNYYAKKNKITIPLEELTEILSLINLPENIVFRKLIKIYQIGEKLPESHKVVWIDAIYSLKADNRNKLKTTKGYGGLPRAVYNNLKKSYKIIIEYILNN